MPSSTTAVRAVLNEIEGETNAKQPNAIIKRLPMNSGRMPICRADVRRAAATQCRAASTNDPISPALRGRNFHHFCQHDDHPRSDHEDRPNVAICTIPSSQSCGANNISRSRPGGTTWKETLGAASQMIAAASAIPARHEKRRAPPGHEIKSWHCQNHESRAELNRTAKKTLRQMQPRSGRSLRERSARHPRSRFLCQFR